MPTVEEVIKDVLSEEYLENHGSNVFTRLKKSFSSKKTSTILNSYKPMFYQESIEWENVKNHVWSSEEKRNENKFPFMQGDIVTTVMISSVGQSELNQQHNLWIICSPTCDLPRGEGYIKVAKVFRVDKSDKDPQSQGHEDFKNLVVATKCGTSKYYPMPPFPDDSEEVFGYYADLVIPYFLKREYIAFATVKRSLKLDAWHLFNAFLMQNETRSNPEDEPKIRCFAEGLPGICVTRKEIRAYHGKGKKDYCVLSKNFIGQESDPTLEDGKKFTGVWIGEEQQKAYWFLNDGLKLEDIDLSK